LKIAPGHFLSGTKISRIRKYGTKVYLKNLKTRFLITALSKKKNEDEHAW